jgi:hypothetical protein
MLVGWLNALRRKETETMKNVKLTGTIGSAYGKELHELKVKEGFEPIVKGTILKFNTTYDEFTSIDEVRAAKKYPDDKAILKMLNAAERQNARTKATNEKVAEYGVIKPELADDPQKQLKQIYDTLIAAKKSEAEARATAVALIGVEWAE